ncbi:phosphoribosyltransferase [Mycolicibacterium fluoranthenivorans]|uniref:Putative phosphoribosyl transferase n=1 Tax=Mycolicibacterium fluoranthenivorans TaxID=258505 RepID=A0A1G4VBS4_9MYCO|nr:phosphoribosyltransferase [Mycolicibacterium fluoranthenivorans]SCX04302.1 putative phosphoribosyl transferase [Mycolicibacterium fluoranthenivorans]
MRKTLRRTAAPGRFADRRDAGRVLAGHLSPYRGRTDLLVLGLARGGVPVGWEVAAHLNAPLDAFLVRKLGVPDWTELAMGALASGGGLVLNRDLMDKLRVTEEQLQETIRAETAELHRREWAYRGNRPPPDIEGRTVILVDDGLATGASMFAAVRAVRAGGPAEVVVAVPVGSDSTCRALRAEADAVICACSPPDFSAVGQVYDDFRQTSDDEVRRLLATRP